MGFDLDPSAIEEAARRIHGAVHQTPVARSATLDAEAGAEVFLKCENLQRIGAFKIRGATNAVQSLSDAEARRGVVCHSSGNHAQAVAVAARRRGIPATVVMPSDAPAVKRAAVAGYGARIVLCEPVHDAREAGVADLVATTGAAEVHPYDDDRVIAGQGTAALELLAEVADLHSIVVPVGGGGLLSGTILAGAAHSPTTAIYGAEPANAADAHRSFHAGSLDTTGNDVTIADGLRAHLSQRTFAIIRAGAADVVTVDEGAIISAMRFVWERTKLLIEPSAAVAVAAVRGGLVPGHRIGLVLSGGNVDLDHLPWVADAGGSS